MTILRVLVVATSLGIATSAQAQAQVEAPAQDTLVLSAMTCRAFIESPKDTIGIVLTWLVGYYHDEDEPAVIDFNKMAEIGKRLGAYCTQNPDADLMDAAEKAME